MKTEQDLQELARGLLAGKVIRSRCSVSAGPRILAFVQTGPKHYQMAHILTEAEDDRLTQLVNALRCASLPGTS